MLLGNFEDKPKEVKKTIDKILDNTIVKDGLLLKEVVREWQVIPKPSTRTGLIMDAHKNVGHGRQRKTLENLKQQYYWESRSFNVCETLSSCHKCQLSYPYKSSTEYKLVQPHVSSSQEQSTSSCCAITSRSQEVPRYCRALTPKDKRRKAQTFC